MPTVAKKAKKRPGGAGGVQQGRSVTKSSLAVNTRTKNVIPKIVQLGKSTTVAHREILRDAVTVEAAYTVSDTVAVQPALSTYSHGSPLGTWLPKIAAEYDNYVFNTLKVHFTTSASSLQKGTMLMAYDPNPEASAPASFSDLRNMAHAVTGPARENLTLDLSPIVKGRKLLTRTKAVTSYPLYDCGRIFLGSTLGDGASVGYYEVEYSVSLMNPQTSPSNEIINVASAPPAVVYTDDGLGYSPSMKFGTSTAGRNAFHLTHYLLRLAGLGDTGMITMNSALAVTTTTGQAVIQGVTYSYDTGVNLALFTFNQTGRYRLTGIINGNYEDYATFGASIVRAAAGGALSAATDLTVTTTGVAKYIPVVPGATRGFSNPTVSDDDMPLLIDQTFVVTSTGDQYTIAVGVRNVTGISQNTTAGLTLAASGAYCQGATVLRLEYIGALPST